MLKGLDISKWQGGINWSSLAKNQDFIIIRSSYGTGFTDEKFAVNRDGARNKNIPHGFYHYAYPNHNSPEDEADWFLSVVSPLVAGELLCLDFEESYPDPVGWSKKFLDRISEKLEGYKPLLYVNMYTTKTHDWKSVADKGYGLWLAYWDYDPDGSFEVPHWNTVAMRQYSNNEQVNGISGRVDGNVFYGDKEQFVAYGVKIGEIPCEKIKQENELLKSELIVIKGEKAKLLKSLNDLNTLYKKLLADDKIEDEEMAQLIRNFNDLTTEYKIQTDRLVELDEKNQGLVIENLGFIDESNRLKSQKFTIAESLAFLISAIRGGGSA